MNPIQEKYPALFAFIGLLSAVAKDFGASGTLLQRLVSLDNTIPQVTSFVPLAGQLGAEIAAIEKVPADLVEAAEIFVTDLSFSSAKAQAILAAAFPLANSLVGVVPEALALEAAIKS
jgi:hypothetical protein